MTIALDTPIEFTFELINSGNGFPATSLTSPDLYILQPGETTLERVIGAEFEQVSATIFRATIPKELVIKSGILGAIVTDGNFDSRDFHTFLIGDGLREDEDAQLPFVARAEDASGLEGLFNTDVTLSFADGSPVSTAVAVADFSQMTDELSNPLPYYSITLPSVDIPSTGSLSYTVEATGMVPFHRQLDWVAGTFIKFDVTTEPVVDEATIEFLRLDEVVLSLVTDLSGQVSAELLPNDYVARISKSGLTFDQNNLPLTVDENFTFFEISGAHTVVPSVQEGFCKIKFRLVKVDGTPLSDGIMNFFPELALTGSGAGVTKQPFPVKTNSNGEGVVFLIRGLTMRVNLEGTRLHEVFEVPDQDEAQLFDLISFSDKGFAAFIANFDEGIRRSLAE